MMVKLSDTGLATLAPGATYVLCHTKIISGNHKSAILLSDACTHDAGDRSHPINFNGDDAIVLFTGTAGAWSVVDSVGEIGPDPGSGFPVCGIRSGTKDRTIVRKPTVVSGNGGDWTSSGGTDADNCEWIMYDKDTGTGTAAHDCILPGVLVVTTVVTTVAATSTTTSTTTLTTTTLFVPKDPNLFISEVVEGSSYNILNRAYRAKATRTVALYPL